MRESQVNLTSISRDAAVAGATFGKEQAATAQPLGGGAKRALDVAFSVFALLFFLPAILLIVVAIKAFSRGPVFYGHTRRGFGGATFRCLKFRSMVMNGDEVLARHLADNPAAAIEWNATQKLRDDPRVTPIGRLLRKSSLDELPQFINVLRGEMSVVGPRPVVTSELTHYGAHAADYLCARPGITGLWQISGRSDTSYAQRVAFDAEYVRSWSLAKDMRIIVMTVPATILQRGSV